MRVRLKTMIVSRSRTMHPQAPPLAIGRTVLNEFDDLLILGVTFDNKMIFEKHHRSVARAASQRLCILRKSWQVSAINSFLGDAFGVLSCPFFSSGQQCGARLPIHTLTT